jgi:hypothetical protein
MTRHDVTELNAESFLEQPTVRPFHWRWGRPAWPAFHGAAAGVFVARVLAVRHLPPSNIDRSASERLCQRQINEAATASLQRGTRR